VETQKTVIQAKPVTLSHDDQQAIITFVKDCETKGRRDRKKYIDHAKQCEDAYHCRMEPIDDPELDWMSNECLPWAYDASDSWKAHIHTTTIPKQDQIFTIAGRTQEDHPGADVMQKYLEYRFERNKFRSQLGKAYDDLKIKNHCCLKVYWKEDYTVEYNWVDKPVTETQIYNHPEMGEMPVEVQTGTKRVRDPKEVVVFNNVWIDVIDLDNFVMFPIRGDITKTTRIHTTYRPYEDLIASTESKENNYFNLSEISLDDEDDSVDGMDKDDSQDLPKGVTKGLKIKEAWIHRVKIGDKVYRNYIATIINDKVLVRFQPFPPGAPRSSFVFMALRPDGDCFYGYGLNSKGLGILRAANKKFNGWIDEGVLTQHGAHKYYDDGVYNPNNVVRRPGAQIKLAGPESVAANLVPLVDNPAGMQDAQVELAALKVEFETVTVPKVVKGMIETGQDHTATEISQAQNNSNGKMHIDAFNINDDLLLPTLELAYQAIYDRAQWDETVQEDIRVITQPKDPATGQPMGELPILPLPEVDIKIVGYQNVIRKQEQLAGMGQAMPLLAQSPAGKYLKWDNVGEDTLRMLELDTSRLYMNEDERKNVDAGAQKQNDDAMAQQQHQQELLIQKEVMTLQLQKEKQDQDYELKKIELELKRIDIEAKYMVGNAELELAAEAQDFDNLMGVAQQSHTEQTSQHQQDMASQQQGHQQAMDQHSAQMSEQQAALAEKTALQKDKQKGE
jgi:hypothetical protein